jgi:NADPH:quinone reductase-like Zn-dependent oxidoreductase
MALPKTYKAFRHGKGNPPTTLDLVTEELPSSLKSNEVLIRIHAVSLNYRDVAMMHGNYPVKIIERCIPASDCAAEVVGIGSEVHDFQIGDRVAPIFDLNNIDGTEEERMVLGGDVDGVLREYAVFDRNVLFHLPKHLSWEEVSMLENMVRLKTEFLTGCLYHLRRSNSVECVGHASIQRHCSSPR